MDEYDSKCHQILRNIQQFRDEFESENHRKLTADETRTLDLAEDLLRKRLSHDAK